MAKWLLLDARTHILYPLWSQHILFSLQELRKIEKSVYLYTYSGRCGGLWLAAWPLFFCQDSLTKSWSWVWLFQWIFCVSRFVTDQSDYFGFGFTTLNWLILLRYKITDRSPFYLLYKLTHNFFSQALALAVGCKKNIWTNKINISFSRVCLGKLWLKVKTCFTPQVDPGVNSRGELAKHCLYNIQHQPPECTSQSPVNKFTNVQKTNDFKYTVTAVRHDENTKTFSCHWLKIVDKTSPTKIYPLELFKKIWCKDCKKVYVGQTLCALRYCRLT